MQIILISVNKWEIRHFLQSHRKQKLQKNDKKNITFMIIFSFLSPYFHAAFIYMWIYDNVVSTF